MCTEKLEQDTICHPIRNSPEPHVNTLVSCRFRASRLSCMDGSASTTEVLDLMSRVLALDYGERRLGVAVGDTDVGVAIGLSTIVHEGRKDLHRQLGTVVDEQGPELLVVGYPLQMDGTRGERCEAVDTFARFLTGWFGIPLVLRDERLTSAEAERIRKQAGTTEREAREGGLVDRAAAILLLQNWFDSSDRSGLTPEPAPAG